MEISDMEKGDKLIVTCEYITLYSHVDRITLKKDLVITFLREDRNALVFEVNGKEYYMSRPYQEGLRLISYPLEPPTTVTGYKKLIRQVAQDMKKTLGVDEIQIEYQTYGELKITIK